MNPLEVQSASEQRTFKLHPAIIYQIIQAQSGTLGKALLELVMNSIDAGPPVATLSTTSTSSGSPMTAKDLVQGEK